MKKLTVLLSAAILSMVVAMPLLGHAAEKKVANEVVMKMGNKVHLFHSSNVAAQKEIAINDILPVYRLEGKTRKEKEIGAVKVLSIT